MYQKKKKREVPFQLSDLKLGPHTNCNVLNDETHYNKVCGLYLVITNQIKLRENLIHFSSFNRVKSYSFRKNEVVGQISSIYLPFTPSF
ncbi:hypothetical protein CICLE_v10010047mg [Citrus x clementina]|uniref:Uncharacterized protein n=1 Tax=Citrus clementina TaxID=85681 RepID=V4WBM5_CITCL|nr:hypothetical protein CICLE_v10010047mg [Citrus x clementina]